MVVPDLKEVKAVANHLHSLGGYWQAEYIPESDKKPADSRMTFTPADYWIGESGICFFSLIWETRTKTPLSFRMIAGL